MSGAPSVRPEPPQRHGFPVLIPISTRWSDNDIYGHINNVVYYSLFDTAVNSFLIQAGALDIEAGTVIGLVVETACRYHSPIAFPDPVTAGIRVARMGRSSVRYEVAVFRGDDVQAAADGHFIHVYVNRESRRPVDLPEKLRQAVATLLIDKR